MQLGVAVILDILNQKAANVYLVRTCIIHNIIMLVPTTFFKE